MCGFHGFGSVLGGESYPTCDTGLDRSRGPIETLQSWNLGTSLLMTQPGGLQAWRLAAWIVILHPEAMDFMESWGIWCPWLDDGKRWYSDGRFSDVL